MRIYHLLQEQEGFTGSYNVVQRYVKKVKKREKERRNLELISAWAIASRMKSRKRNCSPDSMPSTSSCADSVLLGQDMKKGTIENKVRYIRNNLFVPVPEFDDWDEFNRQLLQSHEKKAAEIHYKKQKLISDLFQEDLDACKSELSISTASQNTPTANRPKAQAPATERTVITIFCRSAFALN